MSVNPQEIISKVEFGTSKLNDRIEATFFIIGPEEKEQYLGHDVTLFME